MFETSMEEAGKEGTSQDENKRENMRQAEHTLGAVPLSSWKTAFDNDRVQSGIENTRLVLVFHN